MKDKDFRTVHNSLRNFNYMHFDACSTIIFSLSGKGQYIKQFYSKGFLKYIHSRIYLYYLTRIYLQTFVIKNFDLDKVLKEIPLQNYI